MSDTVRTKQSQQRAGVENRSAAPRHPEAVEIELIRTLFYAFTPSLVLTLGFIVAGLAIFARTGDMILLALLIIGSLVSIIRLICARMLAPAATSVDLTYVRARRLERYFAIPYMAFALMLGLFGLRAFILLDAQVHMLTMSLLIVYCAGVAVGIGLRPRVAIPSMLLALVPVCCELLLMPEPIYRITGGLVAATLMSGIQSVRARHERALQVVGMRLTFANLARKDALTALPNRIALREWFAQNVTAGRDDALIAVHCLDLNGFKPVNDRHGHPVGDALLTAVGKRIAGTIRETDIVVRMGGDEFVVLQHGINTTEEAALLAVRLREAIGQSFRLGDLTLNISTGLGYVIARGNGENLDHLLSLADRALYDSKRAGDVAQYDAMDSVVRRFA